jgi:type VII secretion protein EssB
MENNIVIKRLKANYPAGEGLIKQLEKGGGKAVPCSIESDGDYYVFTYDTAGLMSCDEVLKTRNIEKYEFLLHASELSELTDIFSFTLNPENLLVDEAFRPVIIERNFLNGKSNFISEYKALIGSTIDPSHSFEDYLRGGADIYEQNRLLSSVASAKTLGEITGLLGDAISEERSYNEKNFEVVKKKEYRMLKILLPVFGVIMALSLGLFGYEHFVVSKVNARTIKATDLYFSEDYKSVGKELAKADVETLSDASRYMAAVSAVKSSGLNADQKENILRALEQYKTNTDYLNYWVCIGRQDYVDADQYAQKFRDNEHRVFALSLRRVQLEKDSSISGSEKTEKINELDGEIKALLESINESKYGLTNSDAAAAAEEEPAEKTDEKEAPDGESESSEEVEDGPKLLN